MTSPAEKLWDDWCEYWNRGDGSLPPAKKPFALWLRENLARINAACGEDPERERISHIDCTSHYQLPCVVCDKPTGGRYMGNHKPVCYECYANAGPEMVKLIEAAPGQNDAVPVDGVDVPNAIRPAPEREPPKSLHHPKCPVSQVWDGGPCDCTCDYQERLEREPSESLRDVVESLLWNWDIRSDYWEKRLRAAVAAEPENDWLHTQKQRNQWKARAEKAEQENAELKAKVARLDCSEPDGTLHCSVHDNPCEKCQSNQESAELKAKVETLDMYLRGYEKRGGGGE